MHLSLHPPTRPSGVIASFTDQKTEGPQVECCVRSCGCSVRFRVLSPRLGTLAPGRYVNRGRAKTPERGAVLTASRGGSLPRGLWRGVAWPGGPPARRVVRCMGRRSPAGGPSAASQVGQHSGSPGRPGRGELAMLSSSVVWPGSVPCGQRSDTGGTAPLCRLRSGPSGPGCVMGPTKPDISRTVPWGATRDIASPAPGGSQLAGHLSCTVTDCSAGALLTWPWSCRVRPRPAGRSWPVAAEWLSARVPLLWSRFPECS